MAQKYLLTEEWEARGEWWLPGNPETRRQGYLRFSPAAIKLDLLGTFAGESEAEDVTLKAAFGVATSPQYDHPSAIHGELAEDGGVVVTLFDCHRSGRGWRGSGQHEDHYVANLGFVGQHCATPEDLQFGELRLRLGNLEEWWGTLWAKRSQEKNPAGVLVHSFRATNPLDEVFELPSLSARLTFSGGVLFSSTHREYSFSDYARLDLQVQEPKEWAWWKGVILDLRQWFTLAVGDPVSVIEVAPQPLTAESRQGRILFCRQPHCGRTTRYACDMLLTRPQLGKELGRFIDGWFTHRESLRTVRYLLFEVFGSNSIELDMDFLSLMRAIEAFHRAAFPGGRYMTEDEYRPVCQTLVAAIPQGISSDHRAALKSRIKFGAEYSLRRRVKELWESFAVDTRAFLAKDATRFIKRAVDTRNVRIHDEESEDADPFQKDELFGAVLQLQCWLVVLLCRDMGMDEAFVVERLKTCRATSWMQARFL